MTEADATAEERYRRRFCAVLRERMSQLGVRPEDVAALLGLGRRITYRRLAGETPFTSYETALLCRTYRISTALLWESYLPPLTFVAPTPMDRPFDKAEYLARLRQAARDGGEKTVLRGRFSSDYIPNLYLYAHEGLTLLALYLFELPVARERVAPFSIAEGRARHADWLAACRAQADDWMGIDSREVWGRKPLDYIVTRLVAIAESGLLAGGAEAEQLFGEFDALTDALAASLPEARKPYGDGRLRLGRDPGTSTNNVILLEGEDFETLFLVLADSNLLVSQQPEAVEHFRAYFESAERLAEPVSRRMAGTRLLIDDMRESLRRGRLQVERALTTV